MEQANSNELKRRISMDELVTLTDLEIFKSQMIKEIKLLFTKNGRPIKKWLKSNEVKKLLGLSHGTLQTMRNSGSIPFTKIGGTIYYDQDEIDRLLEPKKKGKS